MDRFKVEFDSRSREYILHVEDNGLSGKYIFESKSYLYIRGGEIYNIDELPPTREEFENIIGKIVACPPTPSGKELEVRVAFMEHTCG